MRTCDTAEQTWTFLVHLPGSPFSPSQVSSSSRLPVPPYSPPPGNTFPCNALQPLSPLSSLPCHNSHLSWGLRCSSQVAPSQRCWSRTLTHRAMDSRYISLSLETLRDGDDRSKEVPKTGSSTGENEKWQLGWARENWQIMINNKVIIKPCQLATASSVSGLDYAGREPAVVCVLKNSEACKNRVQRGCQRTLSLPQPCPCQHESYLAPTDKSQHLTQCWPPLWPRWWPD